jgi:predicted ester cyclase
MRMLTEKALANRRTVERFLAGTHAADIEAVRVIDDTVNAEIVCHGFPGMEIADREAYKAWFRFFRGSFTNMAFETTAIVADDDFVAARWQVQADHSGEFVGIPATGRRVGFDGMVLYRMREGRISETWLHANEAALIGAITALEEAA